MSGPENPNENIIDAPRNLVRKQLKTLAKEVEAMKRRLKGMREVPDIEIPPAKKKVLVSKEAMRLSWNEVGKFKERAKKTWETKGENLLVWSQLEIARHTKIGPLIQNEDIVYLTLPNGQKLICADSVADKVWKLYHYVKAQTGCDIVINDSFRSFPRQFWKWVDSNILGGNFRVAAVGKSRHGLARAVDISPRDGKKRWIFDLDEYGPIFLEPENGGGKKRERFAGRIVPRLKNENEVKPRILRLLAEEFKDEIEQIRAADGDLGAYLEDRYKAALIETIRSGVPIYGLHTVAFEAARKAGLKGSWGYSPPNDAVHYDEQNPGETYARESAEWKSGRENHRQKIWGNQYPPVQLTNYINSLK